VTTTPDTTVVDGVRYVIARNGDGSPALIDLATWFTDYDTVSHDGNHVLLVTRFHHEGALHAVIWRAGTLRSPYRVVPFDDLRPA
jgi:hypothetical protein